MFCWLGAGREVTLLAWLEISATCKFGPKYVVFNQIPIFYDFLRAQLASREGCIQLWSISITLSHIREKYLT